MPLLRQLDQCQRTLKTVMVKVATEKSKGHATAPAPVHLPVHRDFAVSLAAARNRQKTPEISTPNAGVVRSEGGRIWSNFNGLPRSFTA